jgi:hypothetical protein
MNKYQMIVTARVGSRVVNAWEEEIHAQNKQEVRLYLHKNRHSILENLRAEGGSLSARISKLK